MRRQLASVAVVLALALAGCGGNDDEQDSGVATAGGGAAAAPSASASSAASDADQQLKFTQCLRDNGLDVPDPEPGSSRPNINFGDIDQDKLQAALEKCRTLMPNGGQGQQLDPAQVEQRRKLAQCIRENGFPDFPDPDANGNISPQSLNLDRNDPKLQAAFTACQQYVPNFGGGNG